MTKDVPPKAPVPGRVRVASGALRDPSGKAPQGLATVSLVLGLSAFLFCPTVGEITWFLAIPAWITGAIDRRRALAAGRQQSATGNAGRQFGKFLTVVVAVWVAYVLTVNYVDRLW